MTKNIFFIHDDLNQMIDRAIKDGHDIERDIREYFNKQDEKLKWVGSWKK